MPASLFSIVVCFSIMSDNLPNQVQKAIGAIEACQMDDLLYPERSIDHLDFSPIKGIFLYTVLSVPHCTSTFFL